MIFISVVLTLLLVLMAYNTYLVDKGTSVGVNILHLPQKEEPDLIHQSESSSHDRATCPLCIYRGKAGLSIPQPELKLPDFITDPHGVEAAIKEERRQRAFDKFCLHYNEKFDYFCSKPAGHETFRESEWDAKAKKHGYAGVFWGNDG